MIFNKFFIWIIWAMPSARATTGSPSLGYCYAMNQALRIPIAVLILYWNLFMAMIFNKFFIWIIWAHPCGSGFCGLRYATEHPADGSPLGPANPSRNFVFRLKYFFLRSVSELFYFFGDAFGPDYSGLTAARLLLRNEPSPAYPYRNFRKLVTFRNWYLWF